MKLAHHVHTSASPAQVWEMLGSPVQWPQFDIFLTKVRGADRPAAVGQHLVGISRWTKLGIPLDVLEVEPEQRLTMRVRTAPGITEELTFQLTPTTRGGTDICVSIVVVCRCDRSTFVSCPPIPTWRLVKNPLTKLFWSKMCANQRSV